MKIAERKSESGVVLIVVLGGVLILTLIAFALASSVRVAEEELGNRKQKLQSYYMARGAIFTAAAFLSTPPTVPEKALIRPGQRELEWNENLERVKIEIVDENGKIDLNQVPQTTLERLLVALGAPQETAGTLATAITDWRNSSSLARWNSAVAAGNLLQFDPSQSTKIDYRSVEEVMDVPGVTPELFYGGYNVLPDGRVERRLGLRDCLTVSSHSSVVNINYAPAPALLALPGLTPSVVDYIVEKRQDKPFTAVTDLSGEFPVSLGVDTMSLLTTAASGQYTLIASGTSASGVTSRIRALIELQVNQASPFRILAWDDSYVQ